MKKRFLALLITLCMVFSLIPMSAFAAEGSEAATPVTAQTPAADAAPAESTATKAAGDGDQYLAFSSDIHNQSNNTSANRLESFINMVIDKFGKIDYMAFCGDMADASASESNYWTYTSSDISKVTAKNIPACYTTGNHEWSPGNFSGSGNSTVKSNFTYDGPATNLPADARYQIYALGSASSSQSFTTDQISHLTSYLSTADASKPIIVLAHFPLHSTGSSGSSWWGGGRTTSNASQVIDALNNAVDSGKTVIYLWGHNHTNANSTETHYDEFFVNGDSLNYDGSNSKTIKFYYGAAGCMSDSEYGQGSAAVKGKGLVIQFKESGYIGMDYFTSSGSVVTENDNAPHIVQEEVAATGISLDQSTASVQEGKTLTLTATVTPSNATDKKVTWTSSNTTYATVSNGVVTGLKAGQTVTITAALESNSSINATCRVTVTERVAGADKTYVLADSFEDGMDYLIANGDSGNVYVLTNEANGSRTLKGLSASVVNGKITLSDEEAAKAAFTCEIKSSTSGSVSAWLQNGGKYLYTNNANGLAVNSDQTNTDNTGKFWHYKADSKNLLWYFKDESNNDGYNDTSQTYKYYLSCSSGSFTDNHVSTTSLGNTNTPAMYLFVEDDGTPTAVSSVTLSPTTLNLSVGKTSTLTATVLPVKATNKNVTWKSSNTAVATVSSTGVVTAVAPGTATITVTTEDGGKTATCSVNVSTVVTINYAQVDTLEAGKEYLIVNGKTGNVYVLTNEANGSRKLKGLAATFSNGKITLTEEEAAKAVFTAVSNSNSVQGGLYLMNGSNYLYADSNDGLRLVASSTQTSSSNNAKSWHYKADNKNILWFFKDTSSSDGYTDTSQTYKYFLECSNGNFTDNHASTTSLGNTTTPAIYLFAVDDSAPIAVSGVTVEPTTLKLSVGKTATLTATVLPAKATNKNVTWKSSNTSVATVSSTGVVTGVAEGTATITVTTEDGGKTATCNVTVSTVVTKEYVQVDTLEAGKEYLIVNGNTGNVYILSNKTDSGNTGLQGVAATVVNGKITLTEEETENILFTCELGESGNQDSTWLKIGEQYLYVNNAGNLRMETKSTQTSSDNSGKHWHYIAKDGNTDKNLLWYFKDSADTSGSLGYSYATSNSTYRYYLQYNSNGVFTKGTATSTSLQNTNTPAIYLFAEGTHEHRWSDPEWIWSSGVKTRAAVTASAKFTCLDCGDVEIIPAEVTTTVKEDGTVEYTATVTSPSGATVSDTKEKKEALYKIIFTADKTNVAPGDTITVTMTLSPVEHLGSMEMDLSIGEGLTYNGDFEFIDGLKEKLGFSNLDWTANTMRISGITTENDYSSETETPIATFTCTVNEGFTGTTRVDLTRLAMWSYETFENYTDLYEVVWLTVSGHEHVMTAHPAVPATCTEAGNSAYWSCSICGRFFSDAEGTTEIEEDSWIIPATGHDWEFVNFTWTGSDEAGYTAAVANYKCKNDETHTQTVSATVDSAEGTGENAGYTVYTAAVTAANSLDEEAHSDTKKVAITYTISFVPNGGTMPAEVPAEYTVESDDITLPTPTREGYGFDGWFEDAEFSGTAVTKIAKGSTGNKTFYAKWTPNVFTVSFNAQGHGTAPESQTVNNGAAAAEPEALTETGYIFGGWYTEAACENEYDFDTPVTADITLFAKWTAITYTVKFNANSGTGTMADQSFTYDVRQNLTKNVFTKENYTFMGWALSADAVAPKYADENEVVNLTTENGGEIVLYAVWTQNPTVTVTFDKNEGEGTMAAQTIYKGVETELIENTFTREGYIFAGWNTKADGTGTAYADGAAVTFSEDVILYAQWTKNTYTITWKNDDGSIIGTTTVAYGEMPTHDAPTKAADADYIYTFKEWNPAITAVTGDAEYTAVYTSTPRTYGGPVWTWTGSDADGYTKAVATFATNDGGPEFKKTVDDEEIDVTTTAATCVATGKTVYTAKVTFNGTEYTDKKEVVIPVAGHTPGEHVYKIVTEPSKEAAGTYTDTVVCSVCGEVLSTETKRFVTYIGANLALKGNINMNFYVNAPIDDWTAEMKYEKDGSTRTVDLDSSIYKENTGGFKITFTGIAAKEMTEHVTLTIKDYDGVQIDMYNPKTKAFISEMPYAIVDYVNLALAETEDPKEADLMKAILNYGQSAQEQFGFNLENPANPEGYLADEMSKPVTAFINHDYDAVMPENAKTDEAILFVGGSLMLKDATAIRLYFTNEVTSATIDGKTAEVKHNSNGYYVERKDIASKDLDTKYTFKVTIGGVEYTFVYCALSWCNETMSNEEYSSDWNICKALYLYNAKANAFFDK